MLARTLISCRQAVLTGGLALACMLLAAAGARADWQPAQPIDNGGAGYGATSSNGTALAVGSNGLASALFFQPGPSTPSGAPGTPFMVRRPTGVSSSWSVPAAVATPGGAAASFLDPALAAAPGTGGALGNGGVLGLFGFQPSTGSAGVVSTAWPAAASTPGATTTALCTSGATPECAGETGSPAQVAVDGAGTGYAVGEVTAGAAFGDILFARTDPSTGAWQPAAVVAKNGQLPLVAVDPSGDVVVTYARQVTSTPGVYDYHEYAIRELAGQTSFSAEQQISGPNSIDAVSQALALVMDPMGTATALFLEDSFPPTAFPPSAPAVQAVGWPLAQAKPSAEQQVSTSISGGNPSDVTAAADPQGRVTAAWDASAPVPSVFANQSADGKWGAAQQVSPSNGRPTSDIQMAADAGGTATLAYTDEMGPSSDVDIKAARLAPGGSWSTPMSLRSSQSGAGAVAVNSQHVAADLAGQADVIFVQSLNGTNRLFSTRFTLRSTSTAVSCSPSSVAVSQATICTVTVTDTSSGAPSTPTGKVSFSSDTSGGSFSSSGNCTLGPTSTTGKASCQVSYTPGQVGSGRHTITASYGGDADHTPSQGSTTVSVTTGKTGRSTSVAVSCQPSSVQVSRASTCTGTVTDTASGTASTPTGTLAFLSDTGGGKFNRSSRCALAPTSTAGKASCHVSYIPGQVGSGTHTITADYGGDAAHDPSHGATRIKVTAPSPRQSSGPSRIRLIGRMGFVSPGGIVGVGLSCFGGNTRCVGHVQITHGGALVGQRDFNIAPERGGFQDLELTAHGRRLLRKNRPFHLLEVKITAIPRHGQGIVGVLHLATWVWGHGSGRAASTSGASALAPPRDGSSRVGLMGRMGFVSPGGIIGVGLGCFGGRSTCSGHIEMSHNGVVVGRRAFNIFTERGGFQDLKLTRAGMALLRENRPFRLLAVEVSVTGTNGQRLSEVMHLARWVWR